MVQMRPDQETRNDDEGIGKIDKHSGQVAARATLCRCYRRASIQSRASSIDVIEAEVPALPECPHCASSHTGQKIGGD